MRNGASRRRARSTALTIPRLALAASAALCAVLPAPARARTGDCTSVPLAADPGGATAGLRPGASAPRYAIEASFDPATHRVRGRERLHWRNPSARTVCTLYLQLDLNAYEHGSTRWMRAQRAQGRRFDVPAGHWGYTRLDRVDQGGRAAVWMFVAPEGRAPRDRTLVRVDLPAPVAPGAGTALDIAFLSQLPGAWAGSGHHGALHVAAGWFPRMAVLANGDGKDVRWLAPAAGPREPATFDVRLDLPADHALVAAGEAVAAPLRQGGRRVHRFRLRDAAEFAWVAGRRFAPPLQYDYRPPGSGPVRLRVLYRPGHDAAAVGAVGAMVDALRRLGTALPDYPQRTLTAVVGPGALGGQAYPGLFTVTGHGGRGAGARALERLERQAVDGVVAAHFAGRFPAAHEQALTRYWTARILRERGQTLRAPDSWLRHLGVAPALDAFAALRARARLQDSVSGPTAGVARAALALHDLEARIGTPAMDREFRRLLAASGPDASPSRPTTGTGGILEQLAEHSGANRVVDDRIALLRSEEVLPQPGYVQHRGRRVELTRALVDRAVRERRARWRRHAAAAHPSHGAFPFRTVVEVHRHGARVPQLLEVKFADGSVRRIHWDDPAHPPRFEWITASPAVSAQLDPHRQVLLDRNKLDDGRTARADTSAARRWSGEVGALVQTVSALLVGL